jgi:SpoVK/Ycf46/Vps4 family AAA+-type ATPase
MIFKPYRKERGDREGLVRVWDVMGWDKTSEIQIHASELNSKVTSSDSEGLPKSWLDLIFLAYGDLGALLSSFCSILFLVSLRSLFTLLNLSRSSLISWSFLALTSSIEMYLRLSRQLSWMEMRLISFYLS